MEIMSGMGRKGEWKTEQDPFEELKMKQVYYSRIDWWIAGLILGSILFCIVFGIYLLQIDRVSAYILLGITMLMITITLLLAIPCRYILDEDHLLVQSGLIKYIIPYDDIRKIEKSNNPLSSPALSLRRVKISRSKGYILVSPVDRDLFIKELSAKVA